MNEASRNNLLYFEGDSMRGLYSAMEEWQQQHNKRLLSTNIQRENGRFCCIALTNPSEVIICSGSGGSQAEVKYGMLETR